MDMPACEFSKKNSKEEREIKNRETNKKEKHEKIIPSKQKQKQPPNKT